MPAPTTTFGENVGLYLSLVQMGLYITGFIHYRSRLIDLADDLEAHADERLGAYKVLRAKDDEFYDYYCDLPDYTSCHSDALAARGTAWAVYGDAMRTQRRDTRGFAQAQNIAAAEELAVAPIFTTAVMRAKGFAVEFAREDGHTLERWSAIVHGPTNQMNNADFSTQINSTFSALHNMGQGFNSAGVSFGTHLYRSS